MIISYFKEKKPKEKKIYTLKRSPLKPSTTPIKSVGKKRSKWGTLKQYKQVCAEIWVERNATCEKCSRKLTTPRMHNFNHTAGRREHFLDKETIELLCFKCHCAYAGITETSTWLDN